MGYDGLPERFDADIKQPCIAEWRENGPKCKDWTTNLDDCCCDAEITLPPPPPPLTDEERIRLKFKLSMNFDTFAGSPGGHKASRYKLREITDEQAYEAGILGKMLASCDSDSRTDGNRSIGKMAAGVPNVNEDPAQKVNEDGSPNPNYESEMEKALDTYYGELCCISPEVGYTWQEKKDGYGDVFLICKDLYWLKENDKGDFDRMDQYGFCDLDACFTNLGKEKVEETHWAKHGKLPVPACYGLPDFKDTDFEVPTWQTDEANQCQPPRRNEYEKDENGEDLVVAEDNWTKVYSLRKTYQIFWHGGGYTKTYGQYMDWPGYVDYLIKAGQGDSPGGTVCVPIRDEDGIVTGQDCFDVPVEHAIFWSAIPNEQYKLTVRHDLYQFPNFYRTDEGEIIKGTPEYFDADGNPIDHTDIRDVFFADLKGNLAVDGQAPYVAGCHCSDRNDDGINDDEYADINLSYLAGIKGNSTDTKSITINSSEVKELEYCSPLEHHRTIEFNPILPTTLFLVNGQDYDDWIKESDGKYWVDYIKEGQYSVFHVSLTHAADDDHPNNDHNVGCHDQVSYHFAFALNLKDILWTGYDEPDPKCYTGTPAKFSNQPALSSLPKLYYTARTASTEIEYPGELLVLNGDKVHVGEKQCIFLNGSIFSLEPPHGPYPKPAGVDRLSLPDHPLGGTAPWGIGKDEDGHLLLSPRDGFGVHDKLGGLTLLAEVLESRPEKTYMVDESTLEPIVNLHLKLSEMKFQNSHAGDVRAGHAWSHFGPNNPEK
tara:strand:+ start:1713 stop:4019 length:2307 start_codon:yes stop_codon:yes gene_type:complete